MLKDIETKQVHRVIDVALCIALDSVFNISYCIVCFEHCMIESSKRDGYIEDNTVR